MKAWPLAVLLALAPLAAAQAPEAPEVPLAGGTVEAAWTWTPADLTVEQGSFVDLTATARITLTDAVCPQGAMVTVSVLLTPEPDTTGLRTDPLAIEANATVPPGAYGGPAPAFTAEVQVPFQLLVDLGTAPLEYELLATSTAQSPGGCAGAGTTQSQQTEAAIAVRVTPTSNQLGDHPEHEEHGAAAFDFFLEPGARRAYQYNATGRFSYHDHFRPELRGLVVVEDSGPMAADVQVTGQGFNPAEVRIGVGRNVTWTNADRVAHTISADELHPEHAAAHEDGDEHMDEAPSQGNATGAPPSEPPRRSPGAEPLLLGAGLGLAALGHARRRRG